VEAGEGGGVSGASAGDDFVDAEFDFGEGEVFVVAGVVGEDATGDGGDGGDGFEGCGSAGGGDGDVSGFAAVAGVAAAEGAVDEESGAEAGAAGEVDEVAGAGVFSEAVFGEDGVVGVVADFDGESGAAECVDEFGGEVDVTPVEGGDEAGSAVGVDESGEGDAEAEDLAAVVFDAGDDAADECGDGGDGAGG